MFISERATRRFSKATRPPPSSIPGLSRPERPTSGGSTRSTPPAPHPATSGASRRVTRCSCRHSISRRPGRSPSTAGATIGAYRSSRLRSGQVSPSPATSRSPDSMKAYSISPAGRAGSLYPVTVPITPRRCTAVTTPPTCTSSSEWTTTTFEHRTVSQ